ncbi:MAG: cytochrome c biogenesis protein CcdC [Lysinibacillus sp.]
MFSEIPSHVLLTVTSVGAILMAVGVMFVRIKSQNKPVTARKIIIPPIAMSTGSLMFIFEPFRISFIQVLEAAGIGIFFSLFLIYTTKFIVRNDEIFMKRSKAFVFILVGLLIARVIMKVMLSDKLDVGELGGMFFVLAWSMIIPWRLAMLAQYKRLLKTLQV